MVSFISEFWSIPHFNTACQFCWVHLKFKNPWGAREMVWWYYWKHVGRNWWPHLGGCECCCGKARVRRHLYLERVVVCEALPRPQSHSGSQLPSHISRWSHFMQWEHWVPESWGDKLEIIPWWHGHRLHADREMFGDVTGNIPPSLIALAFLGSETPIHTQESGHNMKRYPYSTWYIFLNIINLAWDYFNG